MRSTHIVETQHNKYIFDVQKKELQPISILFASVIKLKNEKHTDSDIVNYLSDNNKVEEINHYISKYYLYEQNGWFTNIDTKKKFGGRLSEADVEYHIANLSQLVFEVTDDCNLNCKYCAYGELYNDYDVRHNSKQSFDNVKLLLDYLIPIWNSNKNANPQNTLFISFYGGEPLMNFKLVEKTVEYIKSQFIKKRIKFSMTTNGVLINRYIDYLVENNFHTLISIDGNDANNSYRVLKNGKNSYNQLYSSIKKIQEKYPEYFNNYINFNSVLHNRNSIEELASFFKSEFGKVPTISPLNDSGINPAKKVEFNSLFKNIDEYKLSEIENYEDIRNDLFLSIPSFNIVSKFIYNNLKISQETPKEEKQQLHENYIPTGTCMPFSKKMFVTVNNKIMTCEKIAQSNVFGFIEKNRVVLNSTEIVKTFNSEIDKFRKQCYECYRSSECTQCIYFINDKEKPVCKGFVNEKNYNIYLKNIVEFLENNHSDYDKTVNKVIID